MSIQTEMGAAWNQLQSLFGKTATINGLTVPVTSGAAVRLSDEYGEGGINPLQAVQIYSQIAGGPIPEIGMRILFQGRTYRVESIRELSVTYEINCVQVVA